MPRSDFQNMLLRNRRLTPENRLLDTGSMQSAAWQCPIPAGPAGRRRWVAAGLVLAVLLPITGCTSLKPIADFGRNASLLAGDSMVANDYPRSLERQQRYGQTGLSVSAENIAKRKQDARRLLEAQQVLQAYGQALGALAADDLPAYDTGIAALNKCLVAGKFATTAETTRYATAAKVGFRWLTDCYRRGKIQQLITTYNPSVQAATAQLAEIVDDGYLTGLAGEQVMFTQLAGRARQAVARAGLDGVPQLIDVLADEYAQELQARAVNARVFVTGLKNFGQGHQALADQLGRGNLREAIAQARQSADELGKIIQSLHL